MNMFSAMINNIWSDDPKDNPEDENQVIEDIEVQTEADEAIRYAVKKANNGKKTLSEEHKRKMEEGRRRYWESKRAAEAAAEIVNEERKRKMQEGRQRYLENRRAVNSSESSEEEVQAPPAKRRKVEFANPIEETQIIPTTVDTLEKDYNKEINSLQSTISIQQAYITQYKQLLAQRDDAIRSYVDLINRYRDTIVHLQNVTKEQYQAIIYNSQVIVQNKDVITRQQQIIADQHSMILNLTTKGGVAALDSGMAMDIASERHANSSSSSSS